MRVDRRLHARPARAPSRASMMVPATARAMAPAMVPARGRTVVLRHLRPEHGQASARGSSTHAHRAAVAAHRWPSGLRTAARRRPPVAAPPDAARQARPRVPWTAPRRRPTTWAAPRRRPETRAELEAEPAPTGSLAPRQHHPVKDRVGQHARKRVVGVTKTDKMRKTIVRLQHRAHEQHGVGQHPQQGSGLRGTTIDDGCA